MFFTKILALQNSKVNLQFDENACYAKDNKILRRCKTVSLSAVLV